MSWAKSACILKLVTSPWERHNQPMKKRDRGLTPKQARFVEEYLIDLNATRAYLRAFGPKLTKNTCRTEGARLLANPDVWSAIQVRTTALQRKLGLSQEKVLRKLMAIGLADMGDVATWKGQSVTFKDSAELTRAARMAIKAIKQTDTKDGGSFSIEMKDDVPALKMLARYTKLEIGEDSDADSEADTKGAGSREEARGLVVDEILSEIEEGTG
jgi:phage terminase small subunit